MHSREQYLARVREEYSKASKRGKTRLLNEARKRTKLYRKVLIGKLAHPPKPEPGKRGPTSPRSTALREGRTDPDRSRVKFPRGAAANRPVRAPSSASVTKSSGFGMTDLPPIQSRCPLHHGLKTGTPHGTSVRSPKSSTSPSNPSRNCSEVIFIKHSTIRRTPTE